MSRDSKIENGKLIEIIKFANYLCERYQLFYHYFNVYCVLILVMKYAMHINNVDAKTLNQVNQMYDTRGTEYIQWIFTPVLA